VPRCPIPVAALPSMAGPAAFAARAAAVEGGSSCRAGLTSCGNDVLRLVPHPASTCWTSA
jgi:hypothetical protein